MKLKILFIAIFLLPILSCKKEQNQNLVDGTYTGTFTAIQNSVTRTGNTTITFENGNYICNGGSNGVPQFGSGEFSNNNKIVTFYDQNARDTFLVYDLVLGGEYNYRFNREKLKIYVQRGQNYYEYNLVKE
jgi:hypothetical protein